MKEINNYFRYFYVFKTQSKEKMKSSRKTHKHKNGFLLLFMVFTFSIYGQQNNMPKAKTNAFWERVNFGGGFGLSIGNNFTNITVAPSAIYNFNDYFALGTGLQYSYLKQKNVFTSNVIGGNLIGLFNPVEEVQFSLELEQVNVNNSYQELNNNANGNFWNTGLFVGAGYRQDNITIGARLNLLYDRDVDLYGSAFMPFVRVFF
jgi:hypothetical protein